MGKHRPAKHPLMRHMIKHQISMEKMCEMISVSRTTVWRWFQYKREPTLSQALEIHAITGIPLRQLALDFFYSESYSELANVKDSDLL